MGGAQTAAEIFITLQLLFYKGLLCCLQHIRTLEPSGNLMSIFCMNTKVKPSTLLTILSSLTGWRGISELYEYSIVSITELNMY